MATKNFTQFNTATPLTTSDYVVGYNADGTFEIKTQVKDILNLVTNTASAITDSTIAGRALLTAATVQAQRDSLDIFVGVANFASLPTPGVTVSAGGSVYITIDNGKVYIWNGSSYNEISPNIKSDWNATSEDSQILNKPSVVTTTDFAAATATLLPTTTYQSASGSFATNTQLQSTSALLTPLTLTDTLTGQLVLNTDFNSYKTNVASATATLLPTTVYQSASGAFVQTVTTTSPGISAVTTIVAVSAVPVVQEVGVLYIVV